MTKEEAVARAERRGPEYKAYLNKKSTHRKQITTMVNENEEPILDENGNDKTLVRWVEIPNAEPEYVVSKVQLAHFIAVAGSLFVIALTVWDLLYGTGGVVALAALTGTGVFEPYAVTGLWDSSAASYWPVDINTDTMRIQGISSTLEGTLLDTDDLMSDVTTTERTHGPTTVTLAVSEPSDNTTRVDGTDLTGTFTDPNNANGATSCLILFKDGASDAVRPLIWWSVLASDVAQDGTDDDLTFNASGLWEMTF
jgi:hypothetical protein